MPRRLVPYLALKHVRRRLLQSGLTVAGVAVGVAVLIVALSLTNGFIDELVTSTLRATPMVTLQSYLAGDTLPDEPSVREAIAASAGVTAAAPFLGTQALIARRASASLGVAGRQGFTQVIGIDPELESAVLDLAVLRDSADIIGAGEGIVLGTSLAQQLGVGRGDSVMLRDISGATATFTVAGTFRVGNELIDAVTSYLSLEALQDYMGVPGRLSGYHVRVADPTRAHEVGTRLGEEFSLRPVTWENLFASLISQLRLQKAVIGVVVFLIVVVAAFGIANVLVLTVAEKSEEIGILRALGASERQVVSIFVLEGLLLGTAGTVLGAGLGVALATYFRVQPFPLPGDLYFITQLPVEVQALDVAWVCAVSIGTSAIAGVFPARRAARLDPVKVLR